MSVWGKLGFYVAKEACGINHVFDYIITNNQIEVTVWDLRCDIIVKPIDDVDIICRGFCGHFCIGLDAEIFAIWKVLGEVALAAADF